LEDNVSADPRIAALPDIHGHAKGEHKPFAEERPIPYTARMLFLWFFHACRRASPRFLMVADHVNYLTFEDPAAVNLVRRALKLAQAGDLYGAAETAGVELGHAAVVSEGLRKGMRYSIGAEVDNDPRSRPDAQNIVDAMRPDGMIRSVHFLPITHPQHGENWMWPFDNPEFSEFFDVVGVDAVWELYMTTLLDAIDKLPGHIVGHFYVPGKFGHWPGDAKLEAYEDRLLEGCAERGLAIEINSRYFYKYYAPDDAQIERYRTAYLRLLGKAKAKGVMVAVGSDAHSPKDQGRAFETVLALLDEAGINEIAFPINGRLARVALRATEEILRQHSASLAAAAPAERVSVDERVHPPEETAPSAPVPEPVAAVAAAPRPRPRPKPRAVAEVSDTPSTASPADAPLEHVDAVVVDAERDGDVEAAPPEQAKPVRAAARKRPAKSMPPETEASVEPKTEADQTEVSEAHEPVKAEHPNGSAEDASPEPAQPSSAIPEPVAVVAQVVASAVAETAKRASSALVEAATHFLTHKNEDEPKPATPARKRKKTSGPGQSITTVVENVKASAAKALPEPVVKALPEPVAKALAPKAAPTRKSPARPVVKSAAKPPAKAPPKKVATKAAPPAKAPAKKAPAAKPGAAKKTAAKKSATKKSASSGGRPTAKKVAARTATRPATKPSTKAKPARAESASKAPKRSAAPKRTAKKSAAKKPAAKKKAAHSRR
jgi:HisJ family histidinol phosphate phosphatase